MAGVTVFGVTGRMGQSVVRALREISGLHLSGAVAAASSARLNRDAAVDGPESGVMVTAEPRDGLIGAAVAVEFSVAPSVAAHAAACVQAGVPLLVGTTGLDPATRAALAAAAAHIPVLVAPNTSIAVTLMNRLVRQAAASLGADYDVEIAEAHHRLKRDAPSGTALALGEAVAEARGEVLAEVAVYDRHGTPAIRQPGSIGFSVLRAGDIVGEHTVLFAGAGERLEFTHRVTDRAAFARGALRAAAWLVGRPRGLYRMEDVLAECSPIVAERSPIVAEHSPVVAERSPIDSGRGDR